MLNCFPPATKNKRAGALIALVLLVCFGADVLSLDSGWSLSPKAAWGQPPDTSLQTSDASSATTKVVGAEGPGDSGITKFVVTHTPPAEADLPFPGKTLKLNAAVPKDSAARMKALVVRDGKLIELSGDGPVIDVNNRLNFSVEVPSPVAELAYQFYFVDAAGISTLSNRYAVKRTCLPDIQITNLTSASSNSPDAAQLITQSKGLERDLELLDRVTVLLDEIQKAVLKKP